MCHIYLVYMYVIYTCIHVYGHDLYIYIAILPKWVLALTDILSLEGAVNVLLQFFTCFGMCYQCIEFEPDPLTFPKWANKPWLSLIIICLEGAMNIILELFSLSWYVLSVYKI